MAGFAVPTASDLSSFIGDSSFPVPEMNQALSIAASTIRSQTRQIIDAVANDVVQLTPGNGSVILLPQVPVTAVALVEMIVPNPVTGLDTWATVPATSYRWRRNGTIYLTRAVPQFTNAWDSVRVTYSHGYTVLPDDLRDLVLQLAARTLVNPYQHLSEATGGVSTVYGGNSAGVTLRDTDLAILDLYTLYEVG